MNSFTMVCFGLFMISMLLLAYWSGYYHGKYSETDSATRKMALKQAQKISENVVEGGIYKFYTVSPFRISKSVGIVRSFEFLDYIEVEDCEHFNFSIDTMDLIRAEKLNEEETKKFKQKYNLR